MHHACCLSLSYKHICNTIYQGHMCRDIQTYMYEGCAVYPCMCVYVDIPTYAHPAILSHCLGDLQTRAGRRMLSQINHSCNTSELQPGRHVSERKKNGSVMKGATCPALPGCRRASLPPPSQTGGCQGTQRRGSHTTWERGLSTGLLPPQGFPSAGSLRLWAALEEHTCQ